MSICVPRDRECHGDRSAGRVTASASASAIDDSQDERDRAADALPQRELARLGRARGATAAATRSACGGGRSLRRNSQTASAATPPSSSQACHAAIAPNVMRRTVPGGTP